MLEIRKGLQRLRKEFQQCRLQRADDLIDGPDRFLMPTSKHYDRTALLAHHQQPRCIAPVGAQDVGQHRPATGVGLAAGLAAPFAIAATPRGLIGFAAIPASLSDD